MKIMVEGLRRIKQKDCTDFINETLAKHRVGKELNSLDKLLNKATFGRYDVNADYTDTDLGVDMHTTIELRYSFVKRGVPAAEVGSRVFLADKAFTRTRYPWHKNVVDTSSLIVHELFHVAGIDEKIVDSQQLTDAIQEHCWTRGSNVLKIGH